MIGQKALLELMIKAIDEGYLGEEFLSGLKKKISDRLQSN